MSGPLTIPKTVSGINTRYAMDGSARSRPCRARTSTRTSCWEHVDAPDRIRTCDLRFRRPTLYPTELQALDLPAPRVAGRVLGQRQGSYGLGGWERATELRIEGSAAVASS